MVCSFCPLVLWPAGAMTLSRSLACLSLKSALHSPHPNCLSLRSSRFSWVIGAAVGEQAGPVISGQDPQLVCSLCGLVTPRQTLHPPSAGMLWRWTQRAVPHSLVLKTAPATTVTPELLLPSFSDYRINHWAAVWMAVRGKRQAEHWGQSALHCLPGSCSYHALWWQEWQATVRQRAKMLCVVDGKVTDI